jgi:hypothetical protein
MMTTQAKYYESQRMALVSAGVQPIKAEFDCAGNCTTCGEAGRCPGWHAPRDAKLETVDYLEGVIHQLSTDSDLDSVTAPHKYQSLLNGARNLLALLDPSHPVIRYQS